MDRGKLQWVVGEIADSLKQLRLALEQFAEDSCTPEAMHECASALHKAQGALQILELHGPALLLKELEAVWEALGAGQTKSKDASCEVLMRAILQTSQYLEHINAGQGDNPLRVKSLLNELRSVRDEPPLPDGALFYPNLWVDIPVATQTPVPSDDKLRAAVRKLRHHLQKGLLSWLRDGHKGDGLQRIGAVVSQLEKFSGRTKLARLWWVCGGFVAAVSESESDSKTPIKALVAQLDGQLKRLAGQGAAGLEERPPAEFLRKLLYYLARSGSTAPRVMAIQETFGLQQLIAGGEEAAQIDKNLGEPNLETMHTVAEALKEDIAKVKDALDLFVREGKSSMEELVPLVDSLRQLSDALGLLGLGGARKALLEQTSALQQFVKSGVLPGQAELMNMASVLLRVDATLDIMGEQGMEKTQGLAGQADAAESDGSGLTGIEYLQLVTTVITEARAELAAVKDALSAFISAPEEREKLAKVPEQIKQVEGGLSMLSLDRPVAILNTWKQYVVQVLLKSQTVPSATVMDSLADTIVGIEAYLEAVAEARSDKDSILEIASAGLTLLQAATRAESTQQGKPKQDKAPTIDSRADDTVSLEAVPATRVDAAASVRKSTQSPKRAEVTGLDNTEEDTVSLEAVAEAGLEVTEVVPAEKSVQESPDSEQLAEIPALDSMDEDTLSLALPESDVAGETNEQQSSLASPEQRAERGLEELASAVASDDASISKSGLAAREWDDETVPLGSGRSQSHTAVEEDPEEQTAPLESSVPKTDRCTETSEREAITQPSAAEHLIDQAGIAGEPPDSIKEHGQDTWDEATYPSLARAEPTVNAPEATSAVSGDGQPSVTIEEATIGDLDETAFDLVLANANELSAANEDELSIDLDLGEQADSSPKDQSQSPVDLVVSDTADPSTADQDQLIIDLPILEDPTSKIAIEAESVAAAPSAVHDEEQKVLPPALAETLLDARHRLETMDEDVAQPEADSIEGVESRESAPALERSEVVELSGSESANSPTTDTQDPIDPEILEVFLEEAGEIFDTLSGQLPKWRENPGNREALSEIRRSFHTLKGSGRLVGATVIGEFAWAIENMLNRVIEGAVTPNPPLVDLVAEACGALPAMIDALKRATVADVDVDQLVSRAETLALNKTVEDAPAAQVKAVSGDARPGSATASDMSAQPAPRPLKEIFQAEARTHLSNVQNWLSASDGKGGDLVSLSRAFHTLYGSAGTAGMADIADVCGTLEAFLTERAKVPGVLDEASRSVVSEIAAALGVAIQGSGSMPTKDVLCERIAGLRQGITSESSGTEEVEDASTQTTDFEKAELYSIFVEEAEEILQNCDTIFQRWSAAPDDLSLLKELQRELHTLKGGARMSNITVIGDLSHSIESALTSVAEGQLAVSPCLTALVQQAHDRLAEMVEGVKALQPVDGAMDLIEGIQNLVAPPAAGLNENDATTAASTTQRKSTSSTWTTDIEKDELYGIFVEEAEEILQNSDAILQRWSAAPDDPSLLKELQRELHTLKGGARMSNITVIGDLSHSLESALTTVADGQLAVSPHLLALVQQAHDRLSEMLDGVKTRQSVVAASDLIAQISALIKPTESGNEVSEATPRPVPAATPSSETAKSEPHAGPTTKRTKVEAATVSANKKARTERVTPPAPEEGKAESVTSPASRQADVEPFTPLFQPARETRPLKDSIPADTKREPGMQQPAAAQSGERIQVDSELLDELVNRAGEISISQSRIEQQVASFKHNLEEMEQTVNRLRDQLRRLDIETESQILFRYQGDADATIKEEDFDPLEFDRFSRMQQLSRGLLESAGDLSSIQEILEELTRESESVLIAQSRVNTDLQEGLMRTRMLPFTKQVTRLRRIVRRTATEIGKKAELRIHSGETQLDRTVLNRMIPPLEHMLRNAVDHGLESPEDRSALGKPETGTISIALARDGAEVVIEVSDDGKGMDHEAIRKTALERGLLQPDTVINDEELLQFVLEPAFSTASKVTQISGRGVGMDVVHTEIKQLGGALRLHSKPGAGTTFTIRLPLTMSVNQALMVEVGDETYAVPLANVEAVLRLPHEQMQPLLSTDAPYFEQAGFRYRFAHLGSLLGASQPDLKRARNRYPIILVRAGQHRMALLVESLLGRQEVVVKSVGPQLSALRWINGATILGDGSVVLILDVPSLVRAGMTPRSVVNEPDPSKSENANNKPVIMVVDDSITVRKVAGRFLSRNGMQVITAKDGVEALALLQEQLPDLMLLDIEMPRMDGFELATTIRNSPRLKGLPIIMITSRTGKKHTERAKEIGVDRYLGKPYHEGELLENINALLGRVV